MKATRRPTRIRFWMLAASFTFAWVVLYSLRDVVVIAGDSVLTVVRVEEDWELVVGTPDSNSIAPQVSCTISPTNTVSSLYATFELNHRSQPDFLAGGLQLQTWNGEWPLTSHSFPEQHVLSSDNEVVSWTQSMMLSDGSLLFEIVSGNSTTWGSFGGQGYLRSAVSTSLSNLNGYTPDTSVQNSGIDYASNRVQSLTLKRVRLITSSGEVLEDATPRVVHLKN